jgi:hypothetical protein
MPFFTLILGQCAYLVEVTVRSMDVMAARIDADALGRSCSAAAVRVGLELMSSPAMAQTSPTLVHDGFGRAGRTVCLA